MVYGKPRESGDQLQMDKLRSNIIDPRKSNQFDSDWRLTFVDYFIRHDKDS